MKILVTGGTGYVGSHATAHLIRAGHEVRLLARRPEQVPISFAPHGVAVTDVVAGDVLDPVAVTAAMAGCDAVVHAAAIFTLDPRRADEVRRTNVRATEIVLGEAAVAGLDPIVHISSMVALVRFGGSGPDLPLGDLDLPYARSKRESEQVARRLQQEGAPVRSVYPGGVLGPLDPYLSDQLNRLRWIVLGRFPLWAPGGLHVSDVRDAARVIAEVVAPSRAGRRYVVPGHHVDGPLLYGTVAEVIGRKRPFVRPPHWFMAPGTRMVDLANRAAPRSLYYPGDREGYELSRRDTRLDDTPAREELGVIPIPFEQTVRDSIAWLVDAGHLPERYRPR